MLYVGYPQRAFVSFTEHQRRWLLAQTAGSSFLIFMIQCGPVFSISNGLITFHLVIFLLICTLVLLHILLTSYLFLCPAHQDIFSLASFLWWYRNNPTQKRKSFKKYVLNTYVGTQSYKENPGSTWQASALSCSQCNSLASFNLSLGIGSSLRVFQAQSFLQDLWIFVSTSTLTPFFWRRPCFQF